MSDTGNTLGDCRLPRGSAVVQLLRVSRVCGAAPVTLERHRCHIIARVSRKYAAVGYVITILIAAMIMASMVLEFNVDVAKNSKSKHDIKSIIIDYVNYILLSVSVALAVWGAPGRLRRFLCYYTRIQEIHVSVENKSITKSLEKVLRVTVAASLAVVVSASVFNIAVSTRDVLYYHRSLTIHAINKMLYIVHVIVNLLVLQIIFIVTPALWTLKAFNKSIITLQDRLQGDGVNEDVSTTINRIRRFVKTYAAITDVCSDINATEGFTMLLILFDTIFRILALAFHTNFTSHSSDSRWWMYAQMAVQMLNLVRVSFNVVVLVEPCHRTHKELKKTQELISRVLCTPPAAVDSVSTALVHFYEVTEGCGHVYIPMGTFCLHIDSFQTITVLLLGSVVHTQCLIGGLTTLIVIIASI